MSSTHGGPIVLQVQSGHREDLVNNPTRVRLGSQYLRYLLAAAVQYA